jgi:hypothetical protein
LKPGEEKKTLSLRIKKFNMRYEFKPKHLNVCGLQLADLVAYPIARYAIDKTRANPAYDVFKNKIYSKGEKIWVKNISIKKQEPI